VYLTDSLDYGNCNCRVITATVFNSDSYTITWTDGAGQAVLSSGANTIQVCPSVPSVYKAFIEDKFSYAEVSITVAPKSECDAKQVTICTKVLIESLNDLIQLYHNAPENPTIIPLSNSATYEGACSSTGTFGSGKLNGIY